jgi:hypothetical protein
MYMFQSIAVYTSYLRKGVFILFILYVIGLFCKYTNHKTSNQDQKWLAHDLAQILEYTVEVMNEVRTELYGQVIL